MHACMQVLSNTVSQALKYDETNLDEVEETARFCEIFNKFFDCLNVRCTEEYIQKRNPNIRPYTDKNDKRLQVCVGHIYMHG